MANGGARRGVFAAVAVIGIGLAAAPLAFQMFTRAPKGGRMITSFRPYMKTAKIDAFAGYLQEIGAADNEARTTLRTITQQNLSARDQVRGHLDAVDALATRWPVINADMSDMLATMRADIHRFRGVSALPPFPLFPFFFVLPGLMLAGVGFAAWRRAGQRAPTRGLSTVLALTGLGLIAAPGVFQMFTRAPGGAAMIDDFRPLMTTAKVTAVQGYFLTLGAAEGQLRTEVLPALKSAGVESTELPSVAQFVRDWPHISFEMAPMIGTMADNLPNYAAVDALPPFGLFPWFFVAPGVLVIGFALLARRAAPTPIAERIAYDPTLTSAVKQRTEA